MGGSGAAEQRADDAPGRPPPPAGRSAPRPAADADRTARTLARLRVQVHLARLSEGVELGADEMRAVARDGTVDEREALASNPRLPPVLVRRMVRDRSARVRLAIARRPELPEADV